MNFVISVILTLLIYTSAFGQSTDTLTFHSKAFGESRTVFVHTPEFYKYAADSVKLPVIYILDGQHDWFVNPLLSSIKYLQYTHEIPEALIVVIPHKNRNKECGITDLNSELPLDTFITEELDEQLTKYHPGNYKVLIGHSFSASFSLYSYYNHPDYYSAIIANTPLDEMDLLVQGFEQKKDIDQTKISIAIGGIASDKDKYHRTKYNQLKAQFPSFFQTIRTFEANHSAHNAVPIVATPELLTQTFESFSSRFSEIAAVNDEYNLVREPESVSEEMAKIRAASRLGDAYYSPEIPDLNGIASRYEYNGYVDHATKVYELGIELYPNYYEFYLYLYEFQREKDPKKAEAYLSKTEALLKSVETNWEEKDEVLKEIEALKEENGWQ